MNNDKISNLTDGLLNDRALYDIFLNMFSCDSSITPGNTDEWEFIHSKTCRKFDTSQSKAGETIFGKSRGDSYTRKEDGRVVALTCGNPNIQDEKPNVWDANLDRLLMTMIFSNIFENSRSPNFVKIKKIGYCSDEKVVKAYEEDAKKKYEALSDEFTMEDVGPYSFEKVYNLENISVLSIDYEDLSTTKETLEDYIGSGFVKDISYGDFISKQDVKKGKGVVKRQFGRWFSSAYNWIAGETVKNTTFYQKIFTLSDYFKNPILRRYIAEVVGEIKDGKKFNNIEELQNYEKVMTINSVVIDNILEQILLSLMVLDESGKFTLFLDPSIIYLDIENLNGNPIVYNGEQLRQTKLLKYKIKGKDVVMPYIGVLVKILPSNYSYGGWFISDENRVPREVVLTAKYRATQGYTDVLDHVAKSIPSTISNIGVNSQNKYAKFARSVKIPQAFGGLVNILYSFVNLSLKFAGSGGKFLYNLPKNLSNIPQHVLNTFSRGEVYFQRMEKQFNDFKTNLLYSNAFDMVYLLRQILQTSDHYMKENLYYSMEQIHLSKMARSYQNIELKKHIKHFGQIDHVSFPEIFDFSYQFFTQLNNYLMESYIKWRSIPEYTILPTLEDIYDNYKYHLDLDNKIVLPNAISSIVANKDLIYLPPWTTDSIKGSSNMIRDTEKIMVDILSSNVELQNLYRNPKARCYIDMKEIPEDSFIAKGAMGSIHYLEIIDDNNNVIPAALKKTASYPITTDPNKLCRLWADNVVMCVEELNELWVSVIASKIYDDGESLNFIKVYSIFACQETEKIMSILEESTNRVLSDEESIQELWKRYKTMVGKFVTEDDFNDLFDAYLPLQESILKLDLQTILNMDDSIMDSIETAALYEGVMIDIKNKNGKPDKDKSLKSIKSDSILRLELFKELYDEKIDNYIEKLNKQHKRMNKYVKTLNEDEKKEEQEQVLNQIYAQIRLVNNKTNKYNQFMHQIKDNIRNKKDLESIFASIIEVGNFIFPDIDQITPPVIENKNQTDDDENQTGGGNDTLLKVGARVGKELSTLGKGNADKALRKSIKEPGLLLKNLGSYITSGDPNQDWKMLRWMGSGIANLGEGINSLGQAGYSLGTGVASTVLANPLTTGALYGLGLYFDPNRGIEQTSSVGAYLVMELIQGDLRKFDNHVANIQRALLNYGTREEDLPSRDEFLLNLTFQMVCGLYTFQKNYRGMHNDFHLGNVFIKYVDDTLYKGKPLSKYEFFDYEIEGVKYRIPNLGLIVKLGDWGHSSMVVKKVKDTPTYLTSATETLYMKDILPEVMRADDIMELGVFEHLAKSAPKLLFWTSNADKNIGAKYREQIFKRNRRSFDKASDLSMVMRHMMVHSSFYNSQVVKAYIELEKKKHLDTYGNLDQYEELKMNTIFFTGNKMFNPMFGGVNALLTPQEFLKHPIFQKYSLGPNNEPVGEIVSKGIASMAEAFKRQREENEQQEVIDEINKKLRTREPAFNFDDDDENKPPLINAPPINLPKSKPKQKVPWDKPLPTFNNNVPKPNYQWDKPPTDYDTNPFQMKKENQRKRKPVQVTETIQVKGGKRNVKKL